jgi:hypothetical protein
MAVTFCLAQIPKAAYAEPPTPGQIDAALDQLLISDPAALAQRVEQMKSEAAAAETESAALKQKATELETRVSEINGHIESVSSTLKALFGKVFQPPVPEAADIQMAAVTAPSTEPSIQMAGGAYRSPRSRPSLMIRISVPSRKPLFHVTTPLIVAADFARDFRYRDGGGVRGGFELQPRRQPLPRPLRGRGTSHASSGEPLTAEQLN